MFSKKNLLAAIALGLSMSLTSVVPAFADGANVSVNVNVNQGSKGVVNWEKGAAADIVVWGIGLPPANMPIERGRILAERAAIVDGYRQLAETINGVQIDSETTMKDLAVESDVVRASVSALVKGALVVEKQTNDDGSCRVKMTIPVYGAGSLASVAIPQAKPTSFISDIPKASEAFVPTKEEKVEAVGYTGIIVDASGLGLQGTFSPVVFDTHGRAIYGMLEIDKDYAISHGMVEYSGDLQAASVNSRAGANPLVVKAVSVKGGGNSVNHVNPVISVEDGDKILYANEKSGMLGKHAVVLVK